MEVWNVTSKHKRPHIPFVSTPKNSQTSETVTESRPVILGPRGQGRDCFQSAGAQHRVTEAFHTFTKGVVTKHTQLPKLIKLCVSHSVVSDSLCPHGLQPARLLCSWDSPGKNTGVGCHFLLQEIFPTQGSNPFSCIFCLGRHIPYQAIPSSLRSHLRIEVYNQTKRRNLEAL